MTNSNRIKLTWISFLSYALTGALVIVTGMVMGNIADYFNLPVSSMSNTFTFLNAGIFLSSPATCIYFYKPVHFVHFLHKHEMSDNSVT